MSHDNPTTDGLPHSGRTTPDGAAHGDTRIALILDRSGSMASIQEQARSAFNEAVERIVQEGRDTRGEVALTVLTFNQDIDEVLVDAPVEKIRKLGPDDYRPDGTTALFDAVARGIDLLEKPGQLGDQDGALVIVVSDGHENSSHRVTQERLVERMQALESTDQWTFTFMCANVDITDLRARMRVPHANVAKWDADADGAMHMAQAVSRSVGDYMEDRRAGLTSKRDFWEKKKAAEEERRSRQKDRS